MQISSPFLSIEVNSHGGGLKSIFDTERQFEYLHPRGSLNHFPIVGKLKDDRYRLGRRYFSMPGNGFLYDEDFALIKHEDDRIRLQFESDEHTQTYFPYKFIYRVDYLVYGPILKIIWTVENLEKKDMFFSLGSNFLLNLPTEGEKLEDYYWSFEKNESFGAYYLQNELINFEYKDDRTVFLKGSIPLNREIFRNGPLIFRDPDSQIISLKNKNNSSEIEFNFSNSRFISMDLEHDFLSMQVAQGVNDYIFTDNDFFKKEGIIQLDPLGVHQEVLEIKFK